MDPWYKTNPKRLEYELALLNEHGITYAIDEDARNKGKLCLTIQHPINNEQVSLIAAFPDTYPYFRFELTAPTLTLSRHQNPFEKNLCLIGRATTNWHTDDTLAAFITERLPRTIAAQNPGNETEEHQGEPVTDYYAYEAETILLIDSTITIPAQHTRGTLHIGLEHPLIDNNKANRLRGAVLEVKAGQTSIYQAPDELTNRYRHHVLGWWYRQGSAPPGKAPDAIASIANDIPRINTDWTQVTGGLVNITAFLLPEEIQWRTTKESWLITVRIKQKGRELAYYARTGYAGPTDLRTRIPHVDLTTKTISIVGAGCIGAPSIIQFARLGTGHLRILDYDYIEPGTIARYPLGLTAAGRNKSSALHEYLTREYPYTRTSAYQHRLGDVTMPDTLAIDWLLDQTNLIYDASAEIGINHLLSDLAREHGIPYVCISTTPGGWGGRVIRVSAAAAGCWMCVGHATQHGEIRTPPGATQSVQPHGCASPTFPAAQFDTDEIANMGVRLATSTLCPSYGTIPWDIGILHLRNEQGNLITPQWETSPLTRDAACQNHAPG